MSGVWTTLSQGLYSKTLSWLTIAIRAVPIAGMNKLEVWVLINWFLYNLTINCLWTDKYMHVNCGQLGFECSRVKTFPQCNLVWASFALTWTTFTACRLNYVNKRRVEKPLSVAASTHFCCKNACLPLCRTSSWLHFSSRFVNSSSYCHACYKYPESFLLNLIV